MGRVPLDRLTHLRLHSHFSLGKGVASPARLARAAAGAGALAAALSDDLSVSGAVGFFSAAKEHGITPLIGSVVPVDTPWGTFEVELLAASRAGYGTLNRLLTLALAGGGLPLEALLDDSADLFLLTGGRKGFPARLLAARKSAELRSLLGTLKGVFRDRLFIALFHDRLPGDGRRARLLLRLAGETGLPAVAALEVRYTDRRDFPLYDALLCARLGITVDTPHPDRARNDAQYLPDREEALDRLPFPGAWANAAAIAKEAAFELLPGRILPPPVRVPEGRTPMEHLRALALAELERRYPGDGKARARLEEELATIEALGLAGFFLAAREVAEFARGRGILAAGRGSAAGSLVAYLLGISRVDPLAHDLLFERFLHTGMKALPDIDIDLSSRRREEVLAFVERAFGGKAGDREAMTANYVTYRLPLAVQDLGRALGLPAFLRNRLTRALGRDFRHLPPGRAERARPVFDEVLGGAPVKEVLLSLLSRMEKEHVRHLVPHVGGVVLSPGPLTDYAPIFRSTGGIRVLALNKDDLEALGLVKLDLLGLRMLAALERAREAVWRSEGVWLDLEALPHEADVYRPLWRGESIGVFQLESPAQQNMCRRLRPESLEDLAHQIALVRPGPIQSGTVRPYLRRRLGKERPRPVHPVVDRILAPTHGVLLFQEQLLRLLHHGAGFSWEAAEAFRKRVAKARDEEDLAPLKDGFLEGLATTIGLGGRPARRLWEMVAAFRGYGFTESHAWAFAQHAYASLWLRAHYPAEFFAALLSEHPGMWSLATLRQEARRLGVAFLPVDVNRSGVFYRVERAGGTKAIRLPLTAVRGVSEETARGVLLARLDGPFQSLEDFAARTGVKSGVLLALARAGAFDALHPRREAVYRAGVVANAGGGPLLSPTAEVPELRDLPLGERFSWELDTQGLSAVPLHPLDFLRDRLEELGATPIAALSPGRVRTAGLVVARQKPPTARGYAFYVLEDGPFRVQVVIPPALWERRYRVLRDGRVLVVEGVYQGDGTLAAEHVWDAGTLFSPAPELGAPASAGKRRPAVPERGS